jgi:O-antigen/teichoic acid export membrane protein
LQRILPAGLLDAGFASLATFALGLFAARYLDAATLGTYALFRTATFAAGTGPTQAILVPATVAALPYQLPDRLGLLGPSLRVGTPMLLVSAALFIGAAVFLASASSDVVLALTVTGFAAAVLSSIQDHVRRMLHLAGVSWRAATVSIVQLAAAVSSVILLVVLRVPNVWVPLGALGVANAVSSLVGLSLARGVGERSVIEQLRFRDLIRSGRWLLVDGLATPAGNFISAGVVTRLAGPSVLGYAEAARVVAQPIMVAALGLGAVIGPGAMEAAYKLDPGRARRVSRQFGMLMVGMTAIYVGIAGFDWAWNPFKVLVPNAYLIGGLVLASVIADLAFASVHPQRAQLVAGRREVNLARLEVLGNSLRIGVAGTAAATGSFAVPGGLFILGVVRWVGYRPVLRALYSLSGASKHSISTEATGSQNTER